MGARATCRRPARGDAMRRAAATRFSERASSVAFANRRRASRRRASRRCRRSWGPIDCAMAADVMPWMNDAHVHLARGQPFLPFGQHGDGSNDLNFPFGGYKLSGNGRDKSLHALDKYTELKSGCAARCRRAARSERAVCGDRRPIRTGAATPGSTRRPYAVSMPGSLCRDEREGGPCSAAGTRLLAVVVRRDGPNVGHVRCMAILSCLENLVASPECRLACCDHRRMPAFLFVVARRYAPVGSIRVRSVCVALGLSSSLSFR